MPKTATSLNNALDLVYRGRSNIPLAAQSAGLTTEEFKRVFEAYVSERPLNQNATFNEEVSI